MPEPFDETPSPPSPRSTKHRYQENEQRFESERAAGSDSSARKRLFGPEDADYQTFLAQRAVSAHPERFTLNKAHPDRAKQFKPFAALRGYEELIDQVMREANKRPPGDG